MGELGRRRARGGSQLTARPGRKPPTVDGTVEDQRELQHEIELRSDERIEPTSEDAVGRRLETDAVSFDDVFQIQSIWEGRRIEDPASQLTLLREIACQPLTHDSLLHHRCPDFATDTLALRRPCHTKLFAERRRSKGVRQYSHDWRIACRGTRCLNLYLDSSWPVVDIARIVRERGRAKESDRA